TFHSSSLIAFCFLHYIFLLLPRPPPRPTLFPYTTLFRSCANEVLRGPGALPGGPLGSGDARLDGSRSGRHRAAQEVLLDALLLLHPFLDRDPDRVGDREYFVRPEPADPVGRDATQLAIHLAERDARSQRECNESPDRLDIGH